MNYFIYASYIALLFCLIICSYHLFRLIRLGAPKDLSEKAGSVKAGVIYSNTKAMAPQHKESAFKHLPTFVTGILFHLGSFLALFLFFLLLFNTMWGFFFAYSTLSLLIALLLLVSTCCGVGLFVKRIISKELRPISNADDYLSVAIVSLFHLSSLLLFFTFAFHDAFHTIFSSAMHSGIICTYYFIATLLFLYIPLGKLKHCVYFLAARYHLGFFYGWRGTWPPKNKEF